MDPSLASLYGALIGATAAIVGGLLAFFAEPIKLYFTHRHASNLLRRALYKEITLIYASLYLRSI